jgi:7-cyano-7-deazaguanine synthase
MSAVVLLSGGLDSAVNLKRASDDTGVALALTFDYGQRAAAREAAAAALMCRQLGVPHRLVDLPWLAEISGSALVRKDLELPRLGPHQLDEARVRSGETAQAVWIPNRNGIFVNVAAAFAESMGGLTVVAGFNAEEAAIFPDNSHDFVSAVNASLSLSTRGPVRVVCYTQGMTKPQIVGLGRRIDAQLACIWSCYQGDREECWECESCARLERALREADAWEWFQTNRIAP